MARKRNNSPSIKVISLLALALLAIMIVIIIILNNRNTDSGSVTNKPPPLMMLGGSLISDDVIQEFIKGFNIVWPGYCMNYALDPWRPEGGIVIPVTDDVSKAVADGIRTTANLTTCLTCQMDRIDLNLGTFTQLSGLRNLQITDLVSSTSNTATFRFHVFDDLKASIKDTKIRVRCHCGFSVFTHNDWHTFGGCSKNDATIKWPTNKTVGHLTISFDPNDFFSNIKFTNIKWIDTPDIKSNFSGCTDVLAIADFLDDLFKANILGGQVQSSAKAIEDGLSGSVIDALNNEADNISKYICQQIPSGLC